MASVKGRLTAEVYLLFEKMKSFGESKRELKVKALQDGKKFYQNYSAKVFSFSTFETYKPIVKNFVHWCSDRYQINHIVEIKRGMLREYIGEQISHLRPNTIRTRLAAIVKLGEGIGKAESFHRESRLIQKNLPVIKPSRPTYQDQAQALRVLEVVEKGNELHGLAMRVQLETSCRVCEVHRLRAEDLYGIVQEEGRTVGLLKLKGKGSRIREVTVSEETYWKLERALSEKKKLISYDAYRTAVYRASEALGLRSGGTHKARRFSVQQLVKAGYKELRSRGLSSVEASRNMLEEANRQLGHSPERKSTTRIYLRG